MVKDGAKCHSNAPYMSICMQTLVWGVGQYQNADDKRMLSVCQL